MYFRRPPEINIQLPQSTWIYLFETINWFLLKFCEIISGKNFELFFVVCNLIDFFFFWLKILPRQSNLRRLRFWILDICLQAMAGLYMLSAIGTHVSFFSLFYIGKYKIPDQHIYIGILSFYFLNFFDWRLEANYFLFLLVYEVILSVETLPALYAQYETQLGTIAARCVRDVKKLCKLFQSNVLDKIPRHMKLN